MRVTLEQEFIGCTFSPNPSRGTIKVVEVRNRDGARFKTYLGLETVNFNNGAMRGQFTHSGTHLTKITCNFSSMKEFQDSIASIST